MQVGEIIFYYASGMSCKLFYVNERQRTAILHVHREASFHDIIPYTGTGNPNYLNITEKTYSEKFPLSRSFKSNWRPASELIKNLKAA